MRISQGQLRLLLPGQTLIAQCEDTSEWLSAIRTAHKVKKNHQRTDGKMYVVTSDSKNLTVTVELTEENNPTQND